MKPSADLFDLIKKLTPTEKRYFVLNSNLQRGQKAYLELFWGIDKMTFYDENELKSSLAEKGIQFAQLHVTKNSLSKQILKALRSFHEKNDVQQKIFALISEANLLEGKGLFKQCLKKLRTGFRLAGESEHFRLQAEIQQKIIDVSVRAGVKNLREFISNNYVILSDIDFMASFNSQTRKVSHLSFSIRQSKGRVSPEQVAKEISYIRQKELPLMLPSEHTSFYTERNYHFANSTLDAAEGKGSNKHYRNLINAWDKRPKLKQTRLNDYKADLSNYLGSCINYGDFEGFEAFLPVYQSLSNKDFISEAESTQRYYYLNLLFFLRSNRFEDAEALIPEIEGCFKKYKSVLVPSLFLTTSFNVFLVFFGTEKYDEAFDWLHRISSSKLKDTRSDIQAFARVMELILNFEMGNYFYVENLYTSVYRDLKKRKQWGEFERAVLSHVIKLTRTMDKKRQKLLWEKLLEKLMKIRTKNKGKQLTFLMEVAVWCKSRAEGIPYFEAAKQM